MHNGMLESIKFLDMRTAGGHDTVSLHTSAMLQQDRDA